MVPNGGPIRVCYLCGRWVRTFIVPGDARLFFVVHNATGFRAGRECFNSGEPVCGKRGDR
jgi:hypothetical protein